MPLCLPLPILHKVPDETRRAFYNRRPSLSATPVDRTDALREGAGILLELLLRVPTECLRDSHKRPRRQIPQYGQQKQLEREIEHDAPLDLTLFYHQNSAFAIIN